jgi:hypothetical protein
VRLADRALVKPPVLADTADVTNDLHRVPPAQARREMAILLTAVAVVILAGFTVGCVS